jgi:hypothetical protein
MLGTGKSRDQGVHLSGPIEGRYGKEEDAERKKKITQRCRVHREAQRRGREDKGRQEQTRTDKNRQES